MYKTFTYLPLIIFLFTCCGKKNNSSLADDNWPSDSIRVIKNNLNYPWEIVWGKDDHIWMTERGGKISKIHPQNGTVVFSSIVTDVVSRGEGGLLGMVQHPGFLTNGLFYIVYNYENATGNYKEKMVQMRFINNTIEPVMIVVEEIAASNIHNGSRLWISEEQSGKIYMTTGDASVQGSAQNNSSLSGKVLRFNLDGSIPADNPASNSPVWSLGHRNQQGLVVANNIMYASEHGPNIEDEVNIIESGRNYGWPTVNGPCNLSEEINFCTAHQVKEPIWSSGNSTIAVCGLDYYNHNRITGWQRCLLMTTLKDESLRVLHLSPDGLSVTNQQTFFKNRFGRLRDICISPQGRVYLCTSNGNNTDQLIEITGH